MVAVIEDTEQGRFPESALLGRARSVLRRTARDMKDALQYVAQLEACANRCFVQAGEEIDDDIADSVVGLLRAVREQHPDQELEVVIFAAPIEARGGEQNGKHDARPDLRRD